jgi:hypothetical protein
MTLNLIPTSHRCVGTGPYGFRLVERAYSSERPEAVCLLPTSIFCPYSDFRFFSRGIVPLYRTTTGPASDFRIPPSDFKIPTSASLAAA